MKIIVGGCPRSGTTAVLMALQAMSTKTMLSEPVWAIEYVVAYWQGRPLPEMLDVYGPADMVVKSPALAYAFAALRRPEHLLVYVVRDPRDMELSLAEKRAHTERIPQTVQFRPHEAAFCGVHDGPDMAVTRWLRMCEAAVPHADVTLRYEDFCRAPQAMLAGIVERAGWSVHDLASTIMIQSWAKQWGKVAGPGRWKHEMPPARAAAICERCKVWMERFGYDTGRA